MSSYDAPLRDMRFLLHDLGLLNSVNDLPGMGDASAELVDAILEEANRLAREKLVPINRSADHAGGAKLENGVVRTPDGWQEAYDAFVEGGWNSVPFDPDYGGQGLPWLVGIAVQEIWQSANLAWALCPLLTQGAVELLGAHGSPEQKTTWLPKLISGEWAGTMNLTEPGAGSDVGALKCRAERAGDHYLIRGQKIFITYGDHEMTDNIVHMVLARTPDAPAGTRGISLFIVPKFLVGADGAPGKRNDLRCISLEEKLGIHGSPTCVMSYGDSDGAIGYLIGEENRGMEYMFTMMNNARLGVGLQGVAIAERAYQQARDYARERVQGTTLGGSTAIIGHPDVRRMLLTMRAETEAARAITYDLAAMLDIAARHKEESWRNYAARRAALMTPVVKAWCTDIGVEVASLGVQVHGGMGYIEETGAAQFARDVRVTAIYEGTNGIQAMDLVGRKMMDGGDAAYAMLDEIQDHAEAARTKHRRLAEPLWQATENLREATEWLVQQEDLNKRFAGAVPYLTAFARVLGGHYHLKAAMEEPEEGPRAKLARFYMTRLLPEHLGLLAQAKAGAADLYALSPEEMTA